jgi:serine/threonine protein kinase
VRKGSVGSQKASG